MKVELVPLTVARETVGRSGKSAARRGAEMGSEDLRDMSLVCLCGRLTRRKGWRGGRKGGLGLDGGEPGVWKEMSFQHLEQDSKGPLKMLNLKKDHSAHFSVLAEPHVVVVVGWGALSGSPEEPRVSFQDSLAISDGVSSQVTCMFPVGVSEG